MLCKYKLTHVLCIKHKLRTARKQSQSIMLKKKKMYIHISIPNYKKQSLNRLGYVLVHNFHPQMLSTLSINISVQPISSCIERT